MRYYKFVSWNVPDVEQIKKEDVPQATEAAENGDYALLKETLYAPGLIHNPDILTNPVYKKMGWAFPFSHLLKKYWIKCKYYGIIEGYAPNKTCIRNVLGKHNVLRIIEVC